jgi:hypothetical protein
MRSRRKPTLNEVIADSKWRKSPENWATPKQGPTMKELLERSCLRFDWEPLVLEVSWRENRPPLLRAPTPTELEIRPLTIGPDPHSLVGADPQPMFVVTGILVPGLVGGDWYVEVIAPIARSVGAWEINSWRYLKFYPVELSPSEREIPIVSSPFSPS